MTMKLFFLILLSFPVFAQEVVSDKALYEKGEALQESTYENNLQSNYISGKGKVKEKATITIKQLNLEAFKYYDELVKIIRTPNTTLTLFQKKLILNIGINHIQKLEKAT